MTTIPWVVDLIADHSSLPFGRKVVDLPYISHFFYRLDILPRSLASGSLPGAAIRLSIEGYTYSVVVFDGNCSEIDVRFFLSQETFTPEYRGSEVQSH